MVEHPVARHAGNHVEVHVADQLAGCTAVFECEQVSFQTTGDHVLFIGRVHRVSEAPVTPLVFQSGHYRMLGEIL